MKNTIYVTREGYEKLYNELSEIDQLRNDNTRKMGICNQDGGDLEENPAFLQLRVDNSSTLAVRKMDILEKFPNLEIIEETPEYLEWDGTTVIRKCKVELVVDHEVVEWTILGHGEGSVDDGILSCDAPLVLSILGHKVGEQVYFNDMQIEIKKVSKVEEKMMIKGINGRK